MWLIHFLPDSFMIWLANILLIGGLAALAVTFFVRIFPFFNIYRIPIQIVSILAVALGIYYHGGIAVEQVWQARVHELEAKIAQSEKASRALNQRLEKSTQERSALVKKNRDSLDREIRLARREINTGCQLNPAAVRAYNSTVTGSETTNAK